MTDDAKTYVFGNDSQVPAWLAMNGNNGILGNNSLGGGIVGFILGLLFGGGWGGFGGFGGNGFGGAAASLGAQATANNNTDLVLNAINGTDADVRLLASTLNADVESVRAALATINTGLATLGSQVGMSSMQIINSIQAGNATLANQLSQCCCENRLLTTQQGYESQIRTLEQTNQLGSQADRNTNSIITAIGAQTVAMNEQFCALKERDLIAQIEALKTQLNNANRATDKAEILSAVSAMISSIKPTTTTSTT